MVDLKGIIPHDELVWWYSASDVFCHPSTSEGWVNVVMEALACGLPIVATPAGASKEIISADVGLITSGFNAEDITPKLKGALSGQWNKEKIIERIRKYSWEDVAEKVDGVFRGVMRDESSVERRKKR